MNNEHIFEFPELFLYVILFMLKQTHSFIHLFIRHLLCANPIPGSENSAMNQVYGHVVELADSVSIYMTKAFIRSHLRSAFFPLK